MASVRTDWCKQTNFAITRMVCLLEVSRSGYYAWIDRKPSERAIRREAIEQRISWFRGDSDEVYGSSRILADLRADGEIISRKTVAATMKRLGLVGSARRRGRRPRSSTTLTPTRAMR